MVTEFRPLHGHAGTAILSIVRMGSKNDDPQFAVVGYLDGSRTLSQCDARMSLVEHRSANEPNPSCQHQRDRRKLHMEILLSHTWVPDRRCATALSGTSFRNLFPETIIFCIREL